MIILRLADSGVNGRGVRSWQLSAVSFQACCCHSLPDNQQSRRQWDPSLHSGWQRV